MTATKNNNDFFISDLNEVLKKFGTIEFGIVNEKVLTVKLAKKTTNVISKTILKEIEAYTDKNYFFTADIEYNIVINIIL